MQIVIDIPKEEYKRVMDGKWEGNDLADYIEKGKPLPKGHGDLIDIDDIKVVELEDSLHIIRHEKGDDIDVYIDALTIIEAADGSEEG